MKGAILVLSLVLMMVSASARTVNVQAIVDGQSELVITPTGLFWHHIQAGTAKPGYWGPNYATPGPTYIDGYAWMPTWDTQGNRQAGVSLPFALDLSQYTGWSASTRYDGYFVEPVSNMNRGSLSSSTFNGYPTILIYDPYSGEAIYSLDIEVVPEPSSMFILIGGIVSIGGLFWRKKR